MNLISPASFDAAVQSAQTAQSDKLLAELEASAQAPEEGKLWEVAEGFEEMFLRLMLGTMQKTTMKSELYEDSNAMDTYRSMQNDFLAKSLAQSHQFGLSEMIVEWMVQRRPASVQATTDATQAQKAYQAASAAGTVESPEIFADRQ